MTAGRRRKGIILEVQGEESSSQQECKHVREKNQKIKIVIDLQSKGIVGKVKGQKKTTVAPGCSRAPWKGKASWEIQSD